MKKSLLLGLVLGLLYFPACQKLPSPGEEKSIKPIKEIYPSRPEVNSFSPRINISERPERDARNVQLLLDRLSNPAVFWLDSYICYGSCLADEEYYYMRRYLNEGWQNSQQLCQAQNSYFLEIAFDRNNHLHRVWSAPYENSTGTSKEVYYAYFDGTSWSSPIMISPVAPEDSINPKIAIDQNNFVHIVWSEPVPARYYDSSCNCYRDYKWEVFWRYFDGVSWSQPVNITNLAQSDSHRGASPSKLVVDNAGNLHLVINASTKHTFQVCYIYCETRTEYHNDVYYLKYDGNSWSQPVNLSDTPTPSYYIDMALDPQGNPHIVWEEADSWDAQEKEIYYTYFDGTSWQSPVNLSNSPELDSSLPSLAIDSQARVHLVWSEGDFSDSKYDLFYLRKTSAGWQGPVSLNRGDCHRYIRAGAKIAVDPNDILHLVFISTDSFTGEYSNVYWSWLDLKKDIPVEQLWVPEINAPVYAPGNAQVSLMGEKYAGRICEPLTLSGKYFAWTGREYLFAPFGLFLLDLAQLENEPSPIFIPENDWAIVSSVSLSRDFLVYSYRGAVSNIAPFPFPVKIRNLATQEESRLGIDAHTLLASEKYLALLDSSEYDAWWGKLYLYNFETGELRQITSEPVSLWGLNDQYLLYETRTGSQPYWLYKISTTQVQNLPLQDKDNRLILAPRKNQIVYYDYDFAGKRGMAIYEIDQQESQLLLENSYPIAFWRDNWIIYHTTSTSLVHKIFLYNLEDEETYTLYETDGRKDSGIRTVATAEDKILIKEDNFCSYLLLDFEPPLPASDLLVSQLEGEPKLKLEWIASPSSDVKRYNIYLGSSPGEIDYSTPYAVVEHPEHNYITPELEPGRYCFGLRTFDYLGQEEKNTNLVACGWVGAGACLVQARIKVPRAGKRLAGNRVTIVAEIIGDRHQVKEVLFQGRMKGDDTWYDLPAAVPCHPNPDPRFPYFIHTDIQDYPEGEYELRAVATDINGCVDPAPESIVVSIDRHRPDQEEFDDSIGHLKRAKVYQGTDNLVIVAEPSCQDRLSVLYLPKGAIKQDTYLNLRFPSCSAFEQEEEQGVGECRMVELESGENQLLNPALLAISYQDQDDDGKLDSTEIDVGKLQIYRQNQAGDWESLPSYVDGEKRLVVANTDHFSNFQLGKREPINLSCMMSSGRMPAEEIFSQTLLLLLPAGFLALLRWYQKKRAK